MRWVRVVGAAFGGAVACFLAAVLALALTDGTFLAQYDVVVASIAIYCTLGGFFWLISRRKA